MQVAKNSQEELVYAQKERYPQEEDYHCYCCNKKVKLKQSKYKKNYFCHQQKVHHQGESATHRLGKDLILHWGNKEGIVGQAEESLSEKKRRGDVYFEALQLVIEIQCSPLSKEELYLRTKDYHKENLKARWIVGPKYFNTKSWRPFFQYHKHLGYYLFYFDGEAFFLISQLKETQHGKWQFSKTFLGNFPFAVLLQPEKIVQQLPTKNIHLSPQYLKQNLQKRLLKKEGGLLKEQEFLYVRQTHLLLLPEIFFTLSGERLPFLKGTNLIFHYLFFKQLALKEQKKYTWHQLEKEWLTLYYQCPFVRVLPFLTAKLCFQSYLRQTLPILRKEGYCVYYREKIEYF